MITTRFETECGTSYLFDGDADPYRVDGALDQDFLLLVAADHHRLQQQLFAAPVEKGIRLGLSKLPRTDLLLLSVNVNLRA